MGFVAKWWPFVAVLLLVALAWYVIFGLGLVPAYSRDLLDAGVGLDFGN